jgi:hypothetical protein
MIMKYIVIRPLLWFCKGDELEVEQITKYFKDSAIEELIKYSYLKEKV